MKDHLSDGKGATLCHYIAGMVQYADSGGLYLADLDARLAAWAEEWGMDKPSLKSVARA